LPKYVAPNLRGPKFVWVPSKSGWLCLGTMALGAWFNWFYLIHHVIESSNWSLVLFSSQCQVKTMKSKFYNIQVSYSNCGDLLEIFDGLQTYLSWSLLVDDHELQRYISSWSNSFGCIWDVWIGDICLCCLLCDDWMDLMISNQILS
jgi:hypothetical protein